MNEKIKGTVLIAEDERSIRSLLRTFLECEGYAVREAADGQETLAALAREVPDALLLDLSMPPPQGMDVLRHIRQAKLARKPAVVILTAYGSVKLAVEAMRLGALDFLEKPAKPEALLETLQRIRRERDLVEDRSVDTYETILARARVALVNSDLKRAEGLLLRAAPLGEKDPAFHNLMGLLTELREDFSGARRHYGKAISLDRAYAPAQQNMRRLYELYEFGQSKEEGALQAAARLFFPREHKDAMALVSDNRAESFLQIIRRAERGRLKIYLGYSPGVGKTYQMLQEAQRLKGEGADLVAGIVETHGRAETAALLAGLDVIPRRKIEYHGVTLEEMDLEAILKRKPQIALVDELAHTNLPGSRNGKRYQDVQDLLAAGIHVISTLNLQHLESLYNTVEKLIGVRVTERLPDSVLAEADQVVNVDLTPEDLQQRLKAGKVYRQDSVYAALDNFFTAANLEQLRELTLREVASQIDLKRREIMQQERRQSPDQVMVCLSSRGPNSAALLRFASRLAGRLNRNWYAVYVQTPSEDPTLIDAATQRLLADNLTLANQLGAMVFTFRGEDVADTILRFAREYRVGHVVIGRPGPVSLWRRLRGRRSVAERLIHEARGLSVVVIDAQTEEHLQEPAAAPSSGTGPGGAAQAPHTGLLTAALEPARIVVWTEPVTREEILRTVVQTAQRAEPALDAAAALRLLAAREAQGSMFLNEGVALPHVRIPNLARTLPVLGLVHGGVIDVTTQRPIELVFGLLSPEDQPTEHLKLLAAAARAFQDRNLRRALALAQTPQQAFAALTASEI